MKRKIVIEIEEGIIASLNDENQWSALLLAELKDAFANGIPLKDEVMIATLMSLVTDKDYKPKLKGEQE